MLRCSRVDGGWLLVSLVLSVLGRLGRLDIDGGVVNGYTTGDQAVDSAVKFLTRIICKLGGYGQRSCDLGEQHVPVIGRTDATVKITSVTSP